MKTFIAVFVFFLIAVGFMAASLTFAKYKKDNSGCCGGGHCGSNLDTGKAKVKVDSLNIDGESQCCGKHKH
jgi:hypothetical protein